MLYTVRLTCSCSSLTPVLFNDVYGLSIEDFVIVFAVSSVFGSVLLTYATTNTYVKLNRSLFQKREATVTKGRVVVSGKFSDGARNNLVREVKANTSTETMMFAICFNMVFFYLAFVLLAFYVFASLQPIVQHSWSILSAAGLVAFVSTSNRL